MIPKRVCSIQAKVQCMPLENVWNTNFIMYNLSFSIHTCSYAISSLGHAYLQVICSDIQIDHMLHLAYTVEYILLELVRPYLKYVYKSQTGMKHLEKNYH